jgi:ACS family D-galactonate transporter-like MFS transporter
MDLSHATTAPMTNIRWKIFILLLGLVTINYIDRAALSVAMPLIAGEFNLTPEQQGLIFSSFFWTYLMMQIPSGLLADRFQPRIVIAGATIAWGVFQGLGMACTGWLSLMLTRLGLGLAESPIYPAGSKLSSLWLTRNERTRGLCLLDGGCALGSGLGAIIVAGLIAAFGSWRIAFLVAGAGTVLCGLYAWWFVRNHPREHPWVNDAEATYLGQSQASEDAAAAAEAGGVRLPVRAFFRFRSVWAMCIGHTCTNIVFYGLMTWLPTYLYKVHGFDIKTLGWATFVIFLCGFIGEVLAGQIADRWKLAGGTPNRVYRTMMIAGAGIVALSILTVAYVSSPALVVTMLCVAVFFLRWCGGCYWTVPSLLATRARTGVLTGIMNFVGNVAGIFVPIMIGFIVQRSGSYFLALMFFVLAAMVQMICSMTINFQKKLPV